MTEEDTFNVRNNMIEQLKKIINDNPNRNNYLGLVNTIVNRELYEWIIQQHPKIENINEKIYLLLKTPKVCDYDNEKPFRDFIKGYGYCGNASNCACLYEVSSRTNAWMKDKTKVKNASKKRKETNIEIYGCENPSGNADVKEKKKQTSQKNWGTDNPMQNSDVVDILEASNLETHGVTNLAKLPATIAKAEQTKIDRYGDAYINVRGHLTQDVIEKINNLDWLINENLTKSPLQISVELNVSTSIIYKKFEEFNYEYKHHVHNSIPENEIIEYISSIISDEIIHNDTTLCHPKHIDIYIPSRNLAIEHDGIRFHGELFGKKTKGYHTAKTEICKENGVQLIHIFGNEWADKKDIVKSRLSSLLGTNTIIYGRKTTIKEISANEEYTFLNNNHMQGYTTSSIRYGLFFDNELIAVMSFSKSRFNNLYQYELLRYASKKFTNIIGGASKLFSHFIRNNNPDSIISYSNRRWGNGLLYDKLSFRFLHTSEENYYYTKDYHILYSRNKFQKHKLSKLLENFDNNLSEWQNMQNNGYDRVWDCGNDVWGWNR